MYRKMDEMCIRDRDDTMLKIMTSFFSVTEEKMPDSATEFSRLLVPYVEVDTLSEFDGIIKNLLSGTTCLFVDGYEACIVIDCRTYPAKMCIRDRIYGYHNVGFHLGTDSVTLDFNGVVPKEKLHEIEQLANEAVAKNLPVQVLYPTDEELSKISYRSKIEIEGQVRIVVIDGYDVCACCAPHVKQTGEIGLIKLVGMQNYKGGVRISMLCGFRALEDYYQKEKNNREIAVMLSAKEYETAVEAVSYTHLDVYKRQLSSSRSDRCAQGDKKQFPLSVCKAPFHRSGLFRK